MGLCGLISLSADNNRSAALVGGDVEFLIEAGQRRLGQIVFSPAGL